jgi:hypothetical protein
MGAVSSLRPSIYPWTTFVTIAETLAIIPAALGQSHLSLRCRSVDSEGIAFTLIYSYTGHSAGLMHSSMRKNSAIHGAKVTKPRIQPAELTRATKRLTNSWVDGVPLLLLCTLHIFPAQGPLWLPHSHLTESSRLSVPSRDPERE